MIISFYSMLWASEQYIKGIACQLLSLGVKISEQIQQFYTEEKRQQRMSVEDLGHALGLPGFLCVM